MGRCGEALQEGLGSLILSDVGFDGVSEGGDVGEVGNAIVLLVGDREGKRFVMSCHCSDDGVHIFSDQIDVVIPCWVVLFVAEDCFADTDSGVDLRAGGEHGLKDLDSNSFNFVRRREGKAREVFLDLVRRRAGRLLANTPFEGRKGVVVGGAAW